MRKMMLLAAMTALAALMLAATPAMANDFDRNDFCGFFDCNDFDEFCDGFDRDFFCDDRFDFNDGFDQDADSGDIDQSFTVNGGGNNSNQSVSIQGVANTGNAQNQIGVFQGPFDNFNGNDFDRNDSCDDFDRDNFCEDFRDFCNDFDRDGFCDNFFDRFDDFASGSDFEFEDSGASIEVSPTLTFESNQAINKAAAAGKEGKTIIG
jgi:hypothetical protein